MKKQYYAIILCMLSGALFAQRETDLGITVINPQNNAEIPSMSIYSLDITIENNGPDDVLAEDTIKVYVYIDGQLMTWQPENLDYMKYNAAITSGSNHTFSRNFAFSSDFDNSMVEICYITEIVNAGDPVNDPVYSNDTSCVTVTVVPQTASLSENSKDFEIFPNPAADYIKVKSAVEADSFSISDATGRKCDAEAANGMISLKGFKPGMYFLHIETTDGIIVRQFIVQ